MTTSQFIAGLIGPLSIAIATFMLIRRESFVQFTKEAVANRPLIFLAGILLLLAGLSIIQTHNLWVWDWRVFITLLGWLCVLGGLVRIFSPEYAQTIVDKIKPDHPALLVTAVLYIALGAFLTAKAYAII